MPRPVTLGANGDAGWSECAQSITKSWGFWGSTLTGSGWPFVIRPIINMGTTSLRVTS
jgi:hypothetical protein